MTNETYLQPVDYSNLDGEYGKSAIALPWPDNLSKKAWKAVDYFDDTAFLFLYRGKFVITDEALDLTEHGDGKEEPYGGPRAVFERWAEIGPWLEEVADDIENFE